jgi:SAM-dependent MidA family methyltransferase
MSGTAMDAVREAIGERGPITFAEYMELALYGPGGFYEQPRIGPHEDFVTSPHVHPIFATLLAKAAREIWEQSEQPVPFKIVEVGPGDGTLAAGLLAELEDLSVRYTAVERSSHALAALALVPGIEPSPELPTSADLVIGNEVLDNLPFRLLRGTKEIRIGLDDDRLIELEAEPDPELLAFAKQETPGGTDQVVPVGAASFVGDITTMLKESGDPASAILIDYGSPGWSGGPVHGYRSHLVVEDVLAEPGSSDITAGIDVAWLEQTIAASGLLTAVVTQREALLSLGFEAWLHDELDRQRRFLDTGRGLEAVRTWSGRSRASLLIGQGALGRLHWVFMTNTNRLPSWAVSR